MMQPDLFFSQPCPPQAATVDAAANQGRMPARGVDDTTGCQSGRATTYPIGTYPFKAGYKRNGTSSDAAERVDKDSWKVWAHNAAYAMLRIKPRTVKELLSDMQKAYPEKMAGRTINSLRPRCTELKKLKLVEETGDRRDGQEVLGAI